MSSSVWRDLYPDDPGKVAQMEARSELMIAITARIKEEGWTGREAARRLGITEPQASALVNGRVSKFSLDALVKLLGPLGLAMEVRREQAIV